MPAGIKLGPWHAPLVIPTTLAPETGEVSWVSMGLRRVLLLAEVLLFLSKSQDSPSGLEVAGFEARSRGIPPAVLRRTGSRLNPAGGREPVCCLLGTCAALGLAPMLRPVQCASGQRPVPSL
jgi:hypothetical protein